MLAFTTQQKGFLGKEVLPLVRAIKEGLDYDPGHSDLDNEQPVHISMTLGEYRKARRVLHHLESLLHLDGLGIPLSDKKAIARAHEAYLERRAQEG